jgi:hypothetical protein
MFTEHVDEAFPRVISSAEAQAIERDMRRIDSMFLEPTDRPVDLASMGLTRGRREEMTR